MSHPIQLIHYACGHSRPVRGAGATVPKICPDCAKARDCLHPGPYCDCDMCQSRIP